MRKYFRGIFFNQTPLCRVLPYTVITVFCWCVFQISTAHAQVKNRDVNVTDSTRASVNIEKAKLLFGQPKKADSLGALAFRQAKAARREDLQAHAAFIVCFANLLNDYNQPKAVAWGDTAIRYFTKVKNFLWAGYVGRNVGIQLNYGYKFERGIDYLNKSSKAFEKAGDTVMVAYNYVAIATAFHDFGDYNSGKKYANMAVKISETDKKTTSALKWKALNALAINYDDNNETDKAIATHLKNISNTKDDGEFSSLYNNLGNSYLKQKKYVLANEYLTKSIAKNTQKSEYQFSTLFTNLSRINMELSNEQNARKYLDSAIIYARRSKSNEKMIDALNVGYLVNSRYNDHEKAADFLTKRVQITDSLLNVDKAKVILDMQTKYETEKKQQQLSLLNKEFQIQGLELGQKELEINNKNLLLDKNNLEITRKNDLITQKQLEAKTKEQKIKLLDTENQIQKLELLKRNITIGIIAGLLLMGSLAGLLFYNRYKLKQETRLQAEVIKQQDMATRAVLNAEENERKRISGELHDGLGQMFSAIKMNLSGIAEHMDFKDTQSKHVFNKTLGLVDESCREVRVISHQMAPNVLLKSGLATAIRDFIDKIDSRKLRVKLETIGLTDRLDQNVETVLYRVIQETVNNVIKHAKANTLDIQLIKDEEGINVMIEDNGQGFDVRQTDKFEGIGLKNIRSRIEYLKGTVDFSSQPDMGTLVAIYIPS